MALQLWMRDCSTPPTGLRSEMVEKRWSFGDSHTHKTRYRAYFGWKEFWARPSCWNSACKYDSDDSTIPVDDDGIHLSGLIGMTIVLWLPVIKSIR